MGERRTWGRESAGAGDSDRGWLVVVLGLQVLCEGIEKPEVGVQLSYKVVVTGGSINKKLRGCANEKNSNKMRNKTCMRTAVLFLKGKQDLHWGVVPIVHAVCRKGGRGREMVKQ
jgi:hypothetical protein